MAVLASIDKTDQMNSNKKVLLTGGLGNQLFQYTFSLLLDSKIDYLDFVATNRRNEFGKPDICDFIEGQEIEARLLQVSGAFKRKLLNFAIRISGESRQSNKLKSIVESILGLAISKDFKFSSSTYIAEGLGFDERQPSGDLFIGYFQSYKYLERLSYGKLTLELSNASELLQNYEKLSKVEKPLIVHYRLGDFLQEPSFGIPSETYYKAAINLAMRSSHLNHIWVFSDQIELAKELFPAEYRKFSRFIDTKDSSSAETLQIMRLGSAYVIANSSFSWWAATLSRKSNPFVVCPSPWFANGSTPKDLFNPNWEVLNRVTGEPDTIS